MDVSSKLCYLSTEIGKKFMRVYINLTFQPDIAGLWYKVSLMWWGCSSKQATRWGTGQFSKTLLL